MTHSIATRRVREAHDPALRAARSLARIPGLLVPIGTLALGALGACATAEHRAPALDVVAHAIEVRGDDAGELERALELAELAPITLPLPDEAERGDPDRDAFWHAGALAWNSGVRAARRRFLGAQARAKSAGAPEPIGLGADVVAGDGDTEGELTATLDVLGLFGLGSAKAARELANEETRLAFAEYEQAVWNAWIDVERARVELASRRALLAAFDELATDNAPLARRGDILESRGFVPAGAIAAARTAEAMLATERSALRTELAEAREALALAAGLPIESAALDADADELLESLHTEAPRPAPPAAVLWDARPEVRAMRVRCALAEAKLRSVLAARFPELRLGVKSIFTPESILVGPMLETALAWPGARDGLIEAAHQECEEMREAVEAELLAALARARTAADVWAEARSHHDGNERVLALASLASWRAARARFLNDPEGLADAAAMLTERMKALMSIEEHDRALALAALEFRRAAGAPVASGAAGSAGRATDASEVQP